MFKRPKYLKPRLVRVRGHGGEPLWGMLMSRRMHTRAGCVVDVVTCGHSPLSARLQIIDNFVTIGILSKTERRSWAAEMRALWRGASLKRNITRIETTIPHAGPCPVNSRSKEVAGHVAFIR